MAVNSPKPSDVPWDGPESVTSLLTHVEELLAEQRWLEARELLLFYRPVVKPENSSAARYLTTLGRTATALREHEEAVTWLVEALRLLRLEERSDDEITVLELLTANSLVCHAKEQSAQYALEGLNACLDLLDFRRAVPLCEFLAGLILSDAETSRVLEVYTRMDNLGAAFDTPQARIAVMRQRALLYRRAGKIREAVAEIYTALKIARDNRLTHLEDQLLYKLFALEAN